MTFLRKLREAAMQCSNVDYRELLRDAADNIEIDIRVLHDSPTEDNMRALIGAWAKAERILDNMPPEGTPAPLAGSPEPALLAMAS